MGVKTGSATSTWFWHTLTSLGWMRAFSCTTLGLLSLLATVLAALLVRRTTPPNGFSSEDKVADGLSGSCGDKSAPSEAAFSVLNVTVDSEITFLLIIGVSFKIWPIGVGENSLGLLGDWSVDGEAGGRVEVGVLPGFVFKACSICSVGYVFRPSRHKSCQLA